MVLQKVLDVPIAKAPHSANCAHHFRALAQWVPLQAKMADDVPLPQRRQIALVMRSRFGDAHGHTTP